MKATTLIRIKYHTATLLAIILLSCIIFSFCFPDLSLAELYKTAAPNQRGAYISITLLIWLTTIAITEATDFGDRIHELKKIEEENE